LQFYFAAIRQGVAKYGKGNWMLIKKRSSKMLKKWTSAQIEEKADLMGLL
jgi:hypothetical protein